MSCGYCKGEGHHNIPDSGICPDCSIAVCTDPSGRNDGSYHGAICRCGCGRLFCRADAPEHAARDHDSQTPNCFPGFAVPLSAQALEMCAQQIGPRPPVDSTPAAASKRALTMANFLNGVAPGNRHCLEFVRASFGDDVPIPVANAAEWVSNRGARTPAVDLSIWGPASKAFVVFPVAFFNPLRCARLLKVAADSLVTAWAQADEEERRQVQAELRVSLDRLTGAVRALGEVRGRWASMVPTSEVLSFAHTWASRRNLMSATNALRLEVPEGPEALLPWIAEEPLAGNAALEEPDLAF